MKKYLFFLISILACRSYTYSQRLVMIPLTSSYTFYAFKIVIEADKNENQLAHFSTEKFIDSLSIEISELSHFNLRFDKSSKKLLLVVTKPTQDGEKNYTYSFSNVDDYIVVHKKRIKIFGSPAKLDIPSTTE